MGGGVGISLPCDFRVATENTRLRHARDQHRPVPRRRRRLVSAAAARPGRPVHGADRCAARRRRMPLSRPRHPLCRAGRARGPRRADLQGSGRVLSGVLGAARRHRPPDAKIEANLPAIARLFASDRLEDDPRCARGRRAANGPQTELATLQHQEPAVVQGLAAAARRRRRIAPASPTRCAPNMRSPAGSSAPTTSAKACARC